MTKKEVRPHKEPWKPVTVADIPPKRRVSGMVSKADVRAIKNCWAGVANEYEQKLALQAIIHSISRAGDIGYYPDGMGGERDSAFLNGMRHVGKTVEKFAEIGNIYLVDEEKTE